MDKKPNVCMPQSRNIYKNSYLLPTGGNVPNKKVALPTTVAKTADKKAAFPTTVAKTADKKAAFPTTVAKTADKKQ